MRSLQYITALAAAGIASANPTKTEKQLPARAASLPTVTASGNAFWTGSTRFFVRGIDYQPGGSSNVADPLADEKICRRDIEKFKKLGVNTIRVYQVDNSKNHDVCMGLLAEAGVYLVLDVNTPKYSINREKPEPSYNSDYLQSIFATIDQFAGYTNTLAFFSGNEVVHDNVTTSLAMRYVKATTRDMRQYITVRGYRKIPVGYSAADVTQNRLQTAAYMNCGTDDERSDFFAFNDYSWCNTDLQISGWDEKVKAFANLGIPIFLSEYGCTLNGRDFGEVKALMSSAMTSVYSGGLLYEYTMEPNNYGIVKINGNTAQELPEFAKFAAALKANPAPTGSAGAATTTKASTCPGADSHWLLKDLSLPAIPAKAKKLMETGAGKGPGLDGPGSQDSGSDSTGTAAPGSGSATSKSDARPIGAFDGTPFIVTGVALLFSVVGAALF